MHKIDLRKIYTFHAVSPAPSPETLPVGGDIYYECLECRGIVSSVPRIRSVCDCGNLAGNEGVLQVGKPDRVCVVRGKLK